MKNTIFLVSIFFVLFSCITKENKKEEPTKVDIKKDTVLTVKPLAEEVVKEPEIIFTVQIGAFKKYGQSFAQLPSVIEYSKDGYSKYSLGSFKAVKEAVKYMYSIREKYQDSFVQALKDGQPIPILEATKK